MDTPRLKKPPVIGKRMSAALLAIQADPGVTDTVMERQYGAPAINRLILAGLIESRGTTLYGRKLFAFETNPAKSASPMPGYLLKGPKSGLTEAQLNAHNKLAVACPGCKSAPGRLCVSKKNGKEVRFPHFERIDRLLFTLALLAFIDDKDQDVPSTL